jgi:hypothetical protein
VCESVVASCCEHGNEHAGISTRHRISLFYKTMYFRRTQLYWNVLYLLYKFIQATCFDPLKGSSSGRRSIYKSHMVLRLTAGIPFGIVYIQAYTKVECMKLTHSMEQSPSWEADQFSQLTKKFPAFYGTRRFFTVLTSARHLSVSWANSFQSPQPPRKLWDTPSGNTPPLPGDPNGE